MDYRVDKENNKKILLIQTSWSENLFNALKSEKPDILRLSFSNGWKDEKIDFLGSLGNLLQGIEVYSWKVNDLQPLYECPNIEYLSFQVELKKVFDLSKFQNLKTFKGSYSAKLKGFEQLTKLRHLNLSNYPFETLQEVAVMSDLENLFLTSKKLKSTDGACFEGLKKLDLSMCSKLEDLSGVERFESLEELELEDCKMLDSIGSLPSKLKSLIIANCGKIDSLDFLVNHENLERVLIIGSTRVADKDLSPLRTLKKLKDVRVASGKYNMTSDEVMQLVK